MRDFIFLSKLYGTILNDWEAEIKIYKAEERELRFPPAKLGEQSVTSFILKHPELPYRIQKALWPYADSAINAVHYGTHDGIGKKAYEVILEYLDKGEKK